jgi:histidyl-tRNA synthetase
MPTFRAPRGTRDLLPPETTTWTRLERLADDLAARYGYRRIETPLFEVTGVFERGVGEVTDIVEKELFRLAPRNEESEVWSLRPEPTAGIVRAYVQHGMQTWPQPVRLAERGPMFRYDRPQAGRYRQFSQWDVEAIGDPGPAIDAELLELATRFYREAGLTGVEVWLNSIGDQSCRPGYVARLNEWLDAHADVLDEDARHKRRTSPLQVFDVKNPMVRAALEEAPKIGESLCDDCRRHFDELRTLLDALGVGYVVDPVLVRGLDYYTRTTFEFVGPEENVNSTLCGGGRYDGLVEAIGGPSTPGVGFGAGIERLLLGLEREGFDVDPPRLDVFFAVHETAPREAVQRAMAALRSRGVTCDTDYARRSIKGQIGYANRAGVRRLVEVVGADRAILRRRGEPDVEAPLDDLLARLGP